MKTSILLIALLLVPFAATPAHAATPGVTVSMNADSYKVESTLLAGGAPIATVHVNDANGVPVFHTTVRVVFVHQVPGVGVVGNNTVFAVTDPNGVAKVSAPQESCLLGNYIVLVNAIGEPASTRYTIGA